MHRVLCFLRQEDAEFEVCFFVGSLGLKILYLCLLAIAGEVENAFCLLIHIGQIQGILSKSNRRRGSGKIYVI